MKFFAIFRFFYNENCVFWLFLDISIDFFNNVCYNGIMGGYFTPKFNLGGVFL